VPPRSLCRPAGRFVRKKCGDFFNLMLHNNHFHSPELLLFATLIFSKLPSLNLDHFWNRKIPFQTYKQQTEEKLGKKVTCGEFLRVVRLNEALPLIYYFTYFGLFVACFFFENVFLTLITFKIKQIFD